MKQILKLFIVILLHNYIFFLHGVMDDPQLFSHLTKVHTIQSMLQAGRPKSTHITIENSYFRPFITVIIENTLEEKTDANLSNGLLRCYKQLCNDNNTFSIEDILDTLPSLIIGLHTLKAGINFPPFLKPETCDLSGIENLLQEILTSLIQCCNNIPIDFNGTFSVIQDIKNTLTICCEDIFQDFQYTWTILNADFNGTFSTLNEINITLTNCCNAIISLITNIESEITYINDVLLPALEANVHSLSVSIGILHSEIAVVTSNFITCCHSINELESTFNFIACMASCLNPLCNIVSCNNCASL